MKDTLGAFIVKVMAAIALICIGGYVFLNAEYNGSTGSYYSAKLDIESDSSYGGDAYTGIQNAGAQAATNAYYIYRRVDSFASKALKLAGAVVVIYGVEKLFVTCFNYTRKKE